MGPRNYLIPIIRIKNEIKTSVLNIQLLWIHLQSVNHSAFFIDPEKEHTPNKLEACGTLSNQMIGSVLKNLGRLLYNVYNTKKREGDRVEIQELFLMNNGSTYKYLGKCL